MIHCRVLALLETTTDRGMEMVGAPVTARAEVKRSPVNNASIIIGVALLALAAMFGLFALLIM